MEMGTPSRMNMFLQKMLGKNNDEFQGESSGVTIRSSKNQRVEYSTPGKSSWMKRFSVCSPTKSTSPQLSTSPPKPPPTTPERHRFFRETNPKPIMSLTRAVTLPNPAEMHDLQEVIEDFEMNYNSPRNKDPQTSDRTGKFVKRMVAAFEQKSKTYKNPKSMPEELKPQRRSMFEMETTSHGKTCEPGLNETYVVQPVTKKLEEFVESQELESHTSHDDTIDMGSYSFEMDGDLSFTTGELRRVESEQEIKVVQRSESTLRRERAPKIVGAFLKKPVEVEDTAIEWIPITAQKLPRKRSFKKLLSILTGKKSSDSSKLFCSHSQNNLNEETKDFRDSGYSDKSCSTSSLESAVSFNELILQQDNYLVEFDKRMTRMSTFLDSKESKENNLGKSDEDFNSGSSSPKSKKMLLEEVPRDEVRLSLGPFFPAPANLLKSSARNSQSNEGKNEKFVRPRPVSFTDRTLLSHNQRHSYVSNGDGNIGLSLDEFKDVELRKSPTWQFPSSETIYDTPKSCLSNSEPGLFQILQNIKKHNSYGVYDIPKIKLPQRPKSSVLEDALSLKRRNVGAQPTFNTGCEFYTFAQEDEPHYATIKPRNIRVFPKQNSFKTPTTFSRTNRQKVTQSLNDPHHLATNF